MATRNGNAAGWLKKIYNAHYEVVYRAVTKYLNENEMDPELAYDQIQEVFLRAFQKYEQLKHHPNVGGWLVKTAELMVMNECRRGQTRKRRTISIDAVHLEPEPVDSAEETYLNTLEADPDAAEVIHTIRSQMPEREYLLYEQFYQKQISLDELGKTYGVSETAIRLRVFRVANKMRQMIKIYFQTE